MDTNDDTNNGTTASSTSGAPSSREREDLVAALDRHHGFLLQTVQGLDEAQLRTRSSVSEFTLAALLKHVAETEEAWAVFARDGALPGAEGWAAWEDDAGDGSGAAEPGATAQDQARVAWDWGVTDADTLPVLTARLAEAAAGTRELVRTLDLDCSFPLPSAPWFEAGASWTVRRVLLHILAEVSQHAGHADIIREGIDGARTMG
ncbi:DUF664 domain-containing protein [Miniimonas sp. S16]|uniref:mycothiol transferase n=1 Tax=Miniimonas sp. S16 TaxID=2171623 RepID=UPI000D528C23|nr:DUF664 domain-containing protein [Miniimonas sp. S16]